MFRWVEGQTPVKNCKRRLWMPLKWLHVIVSQALFPSSQLLFLYTGSPLGLLQDGCQVYISTKKVLMCVLIISCLIYCKSWLKIPQNQYWISFQYQDQTFFDLRTVSWYPLLKIREYLSIHGTFSNGGSMLINKICSDCYYLKSTLL